MLGIDSSGKLKYKTTVTTPKKTTRKLLCHLFEAKRILRCLLLNFSFFFRLRSNSCLILIFPIPTNEFLRKVQTFGSLWRVGYDKLDFVVKNIFQLSSLMNIAQVELLWMWQTMLDFSLAISPLFLFFFPLHAPFEFNTLPPPSWKKFSYLISDNIAADEKKFLVFVIEGEML